MSREEQLCAPGRLTCRQLSVFWRAVMRNLNQQMDIDALVVLASEEIIDVVFLCE
jgi:hypothetical protein